MIKRRIRSLFVVTVMGALMSSIGCVANSTFEQSQQQASAQHQQDQRQILNQNIEIRRLKERTEELVSSLQAEREQLARTEQERKEVRDELLKLKIGQEQLSMRRHDRSTVERPAADLQDENARLRDRLEEAKRRVKEVFQQVQRLLDQS